MCGGSLSESKAGKLFAWEAAAAADRYPLRTILLNEQSTLAYEIYIPDIRCTLVSRMQLLSMQDGTCFGIQEWSCRGELRDRVASALKELELKEEAFFCTEILCSYHIIASQRPPQSELANVVMAAEVGE